MILLTREQLEDRLAALHRASLELVRDLSMDNLLERIVYLARDQVDAAYAALGVFGPDGKLDKFIPVGMTPEEVDRTGDLPIGRGMLGALKEQRRTIRVANINQDKRSEGVPPGHPAINSFLGVPILLGDQLLGQIYLSNKEGYSEFSDADERVIETLAAYAAVAINNARLYEGMLTRDATLIRHNEDLALLNDIATSLASTLNVDDILDQTLSRVMSYLEVEAGEIYLREDGEKELRLALHRGAGIEPFLKQDRFKIGSGLIGTVAANGKIVVNTNLEKNGKELRTGFLGSGFRCIACIPMLARGDIIGVMTVAARHERQFDQRELNLLTAIGTWAAITIENAHLHRQARRLAVLEERERIGMDLHDGIIQSIYAVGLALEYSRVAIEEDPKGSQQKIEQSIDALNKTIRDLRAYILDLRPSQFAGDNLYEGLKRLVEEYRVNTASDVSLMSPTDGLNGLPTSHATALFHICQEALANAAKHSHARHTRVHLWTTRERVLLEVSDNGRGFDLRKMSVTLGHGLSNMHIRARKVGGDVEITSGPEEGTTVLAWVPRRA